MASLETARDKASFRRGERHRALIRGIMLDRARAFPLARPLTGKEIQHRLRCDHRASLAVSTINFYVRRIRLHADLEARRRAEAAELRDPPDDVRGGAAD